MEMTFSRSFVPDIFIQYLFAPKMGIGELCRRPQKHENGRAALKIWES